MRPERAHEMIGRRGLVSCKQLMLCSSSSSGKLMRTTWSKQYFLSLCFLTWEVNRRIKQTPWRTPPFQNRRNKWISRTDHIRGDLHDQDTATISSPRTAPLAKPPADLRDGCRANNLCGFSLNHSKWIIPACRVLRTLRYGLFQLTQFSQ